MGCGFSNPSQTVAGDQLLELAPNPTGTQQPSPDLDRDTLLAALGNVANYLHRKKAQMTVFAIGSAVNTIFFQTRQTTHDVDFFNQNLTKSDGQLIQAVSRYAQSKNGSLQSEWLNNRTIIFIPKDQRERLTQDAILQNEVIFDAPGLQVLAAPWNYAFFAKLDRIAGSSGSTQYDIFDAADYLHRYLTIHHLATIKQSEVQEWARLFGTRISAELIQDLNAEYQRKHGRTAIDIG